ncbi:hypothetical protein N7465_011830 [Penicillium sp. CMV-2018d]|nr:hypothetical protein N7465_011830 [Penicillium sp. CMV-2018d]
MNSPGFGLWPRKGLSSAQQAQGSYQPRQAQQQPCRDQGGRTNQAGQLLLSDKPWSQAGYSNTGYAARQPRMGACPAAAYQVDPKEVSPLPEPPPVAPPEADLANSPPEANLANVAFYDGRYVHDPQADAYYADEEYTSYAEYPQQGILLPE